jgi:hypothetical protein
MPDGRDILRDWQEAMQALAGAVRGAAGQSQLPKDLVTAMQRQLELVQEIVERERNQRAEIFGRLLDPIDAVVDLLDESGKTFRAQADALEEAAAALAQTATLMQTQAELYERAIRTLREPSDLARKVTGASPRQRGSRGGKKKSDRTKP